MLERLQPERVFYHFEKICRIPHGSGNPTAIGDYCAAFAAERGIRCIRDAYGNVVLYKACDIERAPVILQGHLDMVCVADADTQIDFLKDPLPVDTDGEYVFCRGTSLGADDGIAVAMILALLEDDTLYAPPIEAVFTMDEETGMFGAAGFDPKLLRGRRMLNLDSEAEGVFWVSCAGGERVTITLPMQTEACGMQALRVRLAGLQGGHSGTEIDKGRLNAVHTLARLLSECGGRLALLNGGTVDNAIPSFAEAVWAGEADMLRDAYSRLSKTWRETEPGILLETETLSAKDVCFTAQDSARLLSLLAAIPCGVQSMSRDIEGLVETSLNLGVCVTDADGVHLHHSVRSSVDAARAALIAEMERIAAEYGASVRRDSPYPAWQYRADSPLREAASKAYADLYGAKPDIQAIHAGLECGLFSGKIPELDCISMGPDIFDIHSPKERLSVASTARTYALVRKILETI